MRVNASIEFTGSESCLMHAITAYEEKSNCTTILVSTPFRPDGLFQSIEKDPNSKYHKIVFRLHCRPR